MTKHIHIHMPRRTLAVTAAQAALSVQAKAKDAGFDESKVKRDHGQFASKAGAGTQTHHSMIKPGDSLHDKNGQKIDHVESIGKAMRGAERTIHTRAGYQHQTQGGHLPGGMHAKTSSYTEKPAAPASKPQANSSGAPVKHQPSGTTVPHQAPKPVGLYAKKYPEGTHVIHSSGGYAGKVVGHEGEHVHVQKPGEQPRKLLGGMLRHDTARHIDPKAAASAYAGTHAGPLHIGSTKK